MAIRVLSVLAEMEIDIEWQMKLFFEFIQLAVGTRQELSLLPSPEQWQELYALAEKQALVGVCLAALEKLPKEQKPSVPLLIKWIGVTRLIEQRNHELNKHSIEACRYFEEQGFLPCVLKGQGNALMYPWPLRRQCGDIDIWVIPGDTDNETLEIPKSRIEMLRWTRGRYPQEEFDKKHIHFSLFPDIPMEVHFVPSQLRNPKAHRKLIRFYEREAKEQTRHQKAINGEHGCLGMLNCPTIRFNLIFQLTHIFNHFLSEGVGLRQIMDYYFLCHEARKEWNADSEEWQTVVETIREIGLYGFARGLMWVMHEVLGMEEGLMPWPMDERRGRVLLEEILAGGNFGQHDTRYWHGHSTALSFYTARLRRQLHFLRHYPSEVLCDIPFRIQQRLWMWYHGNKTIIYGVI